MKELLEKIRQKRIEMRLSQEEVGRHLGLSESQYSRIEGGRSKLSAEYLTILSKLLNINLGDSFTLPSSATVKSVSLEEYLLVNRQLIEANRKINMLISENQELRSKLQELVTKAKINVLSFLELQMDRLKENIPDYKPNWNEIAKAAQIPDADSFLHQFGEYKAEVFNSVSSEAKPQHSLQMSPAQLEENLRQMAEEQNLSPAELLKKLIETVEKPTASGHGHLSLVDKKSNSSD